MKEAIVVGAGLVGSLWTILLAQRGYRVRTYERRPDLRKAALIGGRSINLAMSNRGWRALEKAGIADQVRHVGIPMHGRVMHDTAGSLTFQPYGKAGEAIYSVSRAGLNLELLRLAAANPNVSLHFAHRCTGFDTDTCELDFQDAEGNTSHTTAPLVFATDGAFSAVRNSLQKRPLFNYSQTYLTHGYKELTIPPTESGDFRMEANALHIWPRGQFMLIALPNTDGSFTCTLFLAMEGGETSFAHLNTDDRVYQFFTQYFPDALALLPDVAHQFRTNPTATLVTIRCSPWTHANRVLLLGDAAHAIVPFYGQGMNAGFEDCTLLDDLATRHHENWTAIFSEFNATRIADANAIADLALRNFVEMRDLVGDPSFLLRKKIEQLLHQRYPDQFLPLYSMVTFSHLPYSQAWAAGKAQDRLFDRLLALNGISDNWQTNPQVDTVFKAWLEGE